MSQRKSGYELIENSAYFTPHWVVDCLMQTMHVFGGDFIEGGAYDPACGDGQIVTALLKRGVKANGQDLIDYGFRGAGVDFRQMTKLPEGFKNIITNPPYGERSKLAVEFVEHSIDLVKETGGIAALLLRADFDSAESRSHLFEYNTCFRCEVRLKKRIQWTNIEATSSPSQNHCWFVWDGNGHPALPYKLYARPTIQVGK